MVTSKKQRIKVEKVCKCGCGKTFFPFPVYRGGFHYPDYIRGHSPNCRKGQFGKVEAWNKGLKKGDHPSIERMGFRPGHEPFFDFKALHKIIKENPEARQKWIEAKSGKTPWNSGLDVYKYPNGIVAGPSHGNWKGNKRGTRDLSVFNRFKRSILERDNFTCQECGASGKGVVLHTHHIVPISHNPNKILDPFNMDTLCKKCHGATDTYGSKAIRKKKSGK